MKFDLLRFQTEDPGGGVPVAGLHLGAGPDFAAVAAEIDRAVQGLQAGVGEVGDLVFGFQPPGGLFQSGIGVAAGGRNQARFAGQGGVFRATAFEAALRGVMLDLAQHCGFKLRLCRPYRARTKGKVERFNGYLKGSFLVPLLASLRAGGLTLEVDLANHEVRRWLDTVANRRIHGTTGIEPYRRLPEDQARLLPLPQDLLRPGPVLPARTVTTALPVESLQHPLSVYQSLLEVAA